MARLSFFGVSLSTVTNMISTAISGIPSSVLNFVNGGAYMTLAQVYSTYPAGAAYDGMYANVNNLYNGVSTSAVGGIKEVLRCRYDITNNRYDWMEQRPNWNISMVLTTGTLSLIPLVTPPTIRLTGTLLGNLTITALTTNAYVGQRFKIIQNSTLGLFATTITGLLGSNITLLGNTTQDMDYTISGWSKST